MRLIVIFLFFPTLLLGQLKPPVKDIDGNVYLHNNSESFVLLSNKVGIITDTVSNLDSRITLLETSKVGISFGVFDTNAYRGDWGHSISNRVILLESATNNLNERLVNLETSSVFITFGVDSNTAYRGDWGNDLSNRVGLLEGNVSNLDASTNVLNVRVGNLEQATNELNWRVFNLETSQVEISYGVFSTNAYRGDWGASVSNQVVLLNGATNNLNLRTEALESATNNLNIRVINLETSTVNISFGIDSNSAYRGDWGNNLSNRVLALETGVVNISFGVDSNSAYRGDWGNSVSNQVLEISTNLLAFHGGTNVNIRADGTNIYFDCIAPALTSEVYYGTSTITAYRGDWGNSVSNTVSNILYSPCWGLTQSTNYFVGLYGQNLSLIRYYTTNYIVRGVETRDGGVRIIKPGYYSVSASTIFGLYTPASVSLRYYLVKTNLNVGVSPIQAGQITSLSNRFDYYYTSIAGIHYFNSNDVVFFGVYFEVPTNSGFTNQGLYGYPHFSGYYLGE